MNNINDLADRCFNIDRLIEKLSPEQKNKVYEFAKALFDEANLTDSNTIKFPLKKISKLEDNDLIAILKSFYKNNIATTILTIKESVGNKEKPSVELCKSITDDESIFYNEKTKINLKKDNLNYLLERLRKSSSELEVNHDGNKCDPTKKDLTSITIVTPQYGNFEFLWIVFNENHQHKKKLSVKSKQTPSDESYGKKLYNLAKIYSREIDLDKSLMDHLNYSIWDGALLKGFNKRKILKQEAGKVKLADGIILKAIPLQNLSKEEKHYYPSL